ncbi:hypothetical protein [Rubellimicrobium aerolatum]|uniref:VPLPA-CTERM sorting domain-containing protein n=1 Tax=Rubellimicrobium aerolatum TaxID=490979 RepID=A0ABW0SG94_9RHOB|nr:hypothetical protein [Rubellimicrobium aerolatum]MBP1807331.1 hypothetical protein [Rubellimicrobium aerolatum]
MRATLLALAAATALASPTGAATITREEVLAAIGLPADTATQPFAPDGTGAGLLVGLPSAATDGAYFALFDVPDTLAALGVDLGILAYGTLTPAGTVRGESRFRGSLTDASFTLLVNDGAAPTLWSWLPFGGRLDLSANGTWTCAGDCRLLGWDDAAGEFVLTEAALARGTYVADPDLDAPLPRLAPVPLPATAPLLALGLAALLALRRRST